MERENYVESLRTMTANMQLTDESSLFSEVIRNGNKRTLSTQTNRGVFLEGTKSKNKRKRQSTDMNDDVKSVKGTVYVDGNNLISDGCGGYYMRVELNDIRPIRSKSNAHNSQHHYAALGGQTSNGPPTYFATQSLWRNSNHRPNTNDRFYSDQSRYSGSDRTDGRNVNYNARNFGQPFQQQKYYSSTSDPFNC